MIVLVRMKGWLAIRSYPSSTIAGQPAYSNYCWWLPLKYVAVSRACELPYH